jgi:hypothetical protein
LQLAVTDAIPVRIAHCIGNRLPDTLSDDEQVSIIIAVAVVDSLAIYE